MKCRLYLIQGAVISPFGEVVIDGITRRKIVRQIIPLTAGAELIEDGVDDFTEIHFSGFASADLGGNESGEDVPLGIGEVGRIGFAGHFGLGGLVKGKSCQVSRFQALHAIPILQIATQNGETVASMPDTPPR